MLITIDARTGRLSLRDSADLAAASRGIHFNTISDLINDNPLILYEALLRLRMNVRWLANRNVLALTLVLRPSSTSQSKRRNTWDCSATALEASRKKVGLSHYVCIILADGRSYFVQLLLKNLVQPTPTLFTFNWPTSPTTILY